ncbi:MAG: pilus assembly protein PilM, partial [Patescibacteria group bacterium]
QALSRITVPEGYIADGIIKNKTGVAALIKQAAEKTIFGKVTSKEAIACLPETKTFIKLISAGRADENLSAAVKSEIEKDIPYDLADVNYDWQTVKTGRAGKKVLIGVAPKKIADDYAAVLEAAGFFPTALEIEATAIARSIFSFSRPAEQTVLIVDIGAARSSLIACAGDVILFTVSLPVSGKKYTALIASELKLPLAKAEEAKIICGLDPESAQGIVADVLSEMTGELIDKIKAAIKHLNTYYPEYGKINAVYLCGGGANLKYLEKIIPDKLNLPAKIGDPLINISLGQKQTEKYFYETLTVPGGVSANFVYQQNTAPIFSTAIGLALRGIKLG